VSEEFDMRGGGVELYLCRIVCYIRLINKKSDSFTENTDTIPRDKLPMQHIVSSKSFGAGKLVNNLII